MLETSNTENAGYEITQINTIENKINIIKKVYSKHNLTYLSLSEFNQVVEINIADNEYKIIKHIFRTKKEKPTDHKKLKKVMLTMLRNITRYINIIEVKENMNSEKKHFYTVNWKSKKVMYYLNLYYKKGNGDAKKLIKIT